MNWLAFAGLPAYLGAAETITGANLNQDMSADCSLTLAHLHQRWADHAVAAKAVLIMWG